VGYFGFIRGEATIDLVARVAERLRGEVEFRFRGVLTTVGAERFRATLERNPNISYAGEYDNPRELAELYGQVDFAWALDIENADANSRWLLPCRFYEAGLFGVPLIAMRGFEVGNLVERLGVGWTIEEPAEDAIVSLFRSLSRDEYARRRARLRQLPQSTFVAGPDARTLCSILNRHVRLRTATRPSDATPLVPADAEPLAPPDAEPRRRGLR
jgi:succinoglycan biosynthesis protein ExoL